MKKISKYKTARRRRKGTKKKESLPNAESVMCIMAIFSQNL